MNSSAHTVVSLAVAGLALALAESPLAAPLVVAVALVAGVLIDVDHFVLAWWHTGGLAPVRRCLRDPGILVFDQDAIFERGEVGLLERLLSHVVIGGVAVPLCWFYDPYLGKLVAAVVYAHVLADLVADTRDAVVLEADDPRLR
ncbi:MAG: hypothetical protein V5A44_03200 [Haloarculaceae archaeon]